MNKYRGLVAFILAVVFGLLAVVLADKWLSTRGRQTAVTQNTVPLARIVVAAKDLGVGAPLKKEMLTLAEWPEANLPKGAFYSVATLENRVAVTRILTGQPVIDAAVAPPGSGGGLVAKISPGMRAIAIRVDEITGVGGFLLPDTWVDVHCIESGKTGGKFTKIVLKNIKVLAIAQEAAKEDGNPKIVHSVTLELNPEQAEILALQANNGIIHLTLRTSLVAPERATVFTESSGPETHKPRQPTLRPGPVHYPPEAQPYTVEVFRGSATPEKVKFKQLNSDERL